MTTTACALSASDFELSTLTSAGTERSENEDSCAAWLGDGVGIVVVADGVSGRSGGGVASQTAVDALLRSYHEQPSTVSSEKRLYRAVQKANIAVYDLSVVVPELAGMATTLTAAIIERNELSIMHVGDSRLYLVRDGRIRQLTKDHTVAARRTRLRARSDAELRADPGRSVLTKSVGRELIAAVDRITTRVQPGDVLVLCSDGLYNVLYDEEIGAAVSGLRADGACHALIDAANRRGTPDNLTAAVVLVTGSSASAPSERGLAATLRRIVQRGRAT